MSVIILLLPFATLIVLNLLPRRTQGGAWILCLVIFALQTAFAAAYSFVPHDWAWSSSLVKTVGFPLTIDALSLLLMGTAGIAGCAALILSSGRAATARTRFSFCNLFLVALAGMNGISMARDLFTLYVFIEVTAVAAFLLVAVRDTKNGIEGAWKYLIMSAMASVFMLTGIAFFLLGAGAVSFADTAAALATPTPLVWVASALFLCGLFVKGAMIPFHGWLADAYTESPPAVAVFLAGILTKASGIFALMRLVPLLPLGTGPVRMIVLVVGTVSAVGGAFLALTQKDMKRMLAWSSLSQMGYIVMALGGETSLALVAAGLHFFNHTVSKAQLFANAAAVEEQLHTRDMDGMGGLAARMPITAGTSAVATLSISGLPPLAGFWSKLLIVIALWKAGQTVFAVIAILTSLVTLAYFLALQRRAFFGTIAAEWESVKEAGPGFTVPALVLAGITILVGLGFPLLLPLLLGGGV
jgi:proton-translocating NADH-quinone oxidoreductase chain N